MYAGQLVNILYGKLLFNFRIAKLQFLLTSPCLTSCVLEDLLHSSDCFHSSSEASNVLSKILSLQACENEKIFLFVLASVRLFREIKRMNMGEATPIMSSIMKN
jgi:hypothetical protein